MNVGSGKLRGLPAAAIADMLNMRIASITENTPVASPLIMPTPERHRLLGFLREALYKDCPKVNGQEDRRKLPLRLVPLAEFDHFSLTALIATFFSTAIQFLYPKAPSYPVECEWYTETMHRFLVFFALRYRQHQRDLEAFATAECETPSSNPERRISLKYAESRMRECSDLSGQPRDWTKVRACLRSLR
ncbi:hypothetical protein JCM8547_007389 [Rhodosporidiobolus lusitaniae]